MQTPSDADIRDWCRACGAEDQVPDLIATARAVESAYLEFRRQSRAGMKRVLGAHTVALYKRTSVFRIYEHNVIPGLFQTAAYCAAMLSFWIGFLDAPDDLDAAVAARMERQKIIYDPGKRFTVVLEEQALRTWFGTADVQAGQLGRLLEVMSVPTVSLGIIPLKTERTGVPAAGFWIFDDALAALEIPTASIEVTRPDEVGLYARMFSHLEESTVHGAAARRLIIRALRELQLAQQLATLWIRRICGSYDRRMSSPERTHHDTTPDSETCRAHLEALAGALQSSPALNAETYRLHLSERCVLHVCYLAADGLAEQIDCERAEGDGWWFTWSWGDTIGPASDPVGVAKVIVHVLRASHPQTSAT